MGYVLNPCTQAILIKSKDDDRIVARSIIRMLWDEEKRKPILLLEKNYISEGLAPVKFEQMITNFAISRAKELGLQIVSKCFSKFSKGSCKIKVVSYDSGKAPFEYSDSAFAITNGKYILKDTFNTLYSPIIERKRDSFKSNVSNEINI
jgi:hypothetical protein